MSIAAFLQDHDHLSLNEAAGLLHTDREHVLAMVGTGALVAVKVKDRLVVTRPSLQRHLAAAAARGER